MNVNGRALFKGHAVLRFGRPTDIAYLGMLDIPISHASPVDLATTLSMILMESCLDAVGYWRSDLTTPVIFRSTLCYGRDLFPEEK